MSGILAKIGQGHASTVAPVPFAVLTPNPQARRGSVNLRICEDGSLIATPRKPTDRAC